MNFLHLPTLPDHLRDLEVALLPPLVVVLFQYDCSTLLSLHISLVTGITGLAPVCSVEFPPPVFLPLQCL